MMNKNRAKVKKNFDICKKNCNFAPFFNSNKYEKNSCSGFDGL